MLDKLILTATAGLLLATAGATVANADKAKSLLLRGVRQTERTTVCAKSDGTPMAHQTVAGAWTRYAKEHGLEISFHGLRHSNTIALLTSGVDVKTAAARLGPTRRCSCGPTPTSCRLRTVTRADRLGSALAF